MKKIVILLMLISLLSCNNKRNYDQPLLDTTQVSVIDTSHYNEIRYVTAKHFTSSGLYNLHCKLCHGVDGTGTGPITKFETDICPYDLTKMERSDKEVYYVIVNGTEHMPDASKPVAKHILTDDDIWMIVFYIKKFKE